MSDWAGYDSDEVDRFRRAEARERRAKSRDEIQWDDEILRDPWFRHADPAPRSSDADVMWEVAVYVLCGLTAFVLGAHVLLWCVRQVIR